MKFSHPPYVVLKYNRADVTAYGDIAAKPKYVNINTHPHTHTHNQ